MPAAALLAAPETLHPALWRAHQLGGGRMAVAATGFAALDAELPGGGWPQRALTELLLPHPGVGEMRLLAPALARIATTRSVMLFDPPASPCAAALAQLGVDLGRLVVVHGRDGAHGAHGVRRLPAAADLLWALEQALASGQVGAVLAWLPARLPAQALRRLQLAAQAHDGPAFVLRDIALRARPSPAPLRLALHSAGVDALAVQVLKRRGPLPQRPLRLALPSVLAPVLHARARAERAAAQLLARAAGPAAHSPRAGDGAAPLPLAG